jgi:phosphatidylcholine synthase
LGQWSVTEPTPPILPGHPAFLRTLVFLVHLLTASGAAFSLLALVAAIEWHWPQMFGWLAVALFVDGIDGILARKLRAAETWPRFSGDTLDLVVDYLSYVLVPALAIETGAILPPSLEMAAAAAILVSSAIYFADRKMKTDNWYFRGFPATWNLIAFYLFLLRPDPRLALAIVVAFVALTFLPVLFIHPLRVKRLRPLNIALTAIWCVLAILTLWLDFSPPAYVTAILCVIGVYFLLAGLLRPRTKAPT